MPKFDGLLTFLMLLVGSAIGFGVGVFWAQRENLDFTPIIVNNSNTQHYKTAYHKSQDLVASLSAQLATTLANNQPHTVYIEVPVPSAPNAASISVSTYTGEELWQAVNKYRIEHGVPPLSFHPDLCQLSSRRLGELLERGSLDNHAGFEKYFDEHSLEDFDNLSVVAENLAYGYPTAWESVMGWDSSPPHRQFLLVDGSFKYGCTSANRTFAVLIAGY